MNVIVLPKNQNMKFIYAFIHKNQRSNMTWWVNTNSTSNIMYVAYTMANKYVILIPPLWPNSNYSEKNLQRITNSKFG